MSVASKMRDQQVTRDNDGTGTKIAEATPALHLLDVDISSLDTGSPQSPQMSQIDFEAPWSLKIHASALGRLESAKKRRRRPSGHAGGRRRGRHLQSANSQEMTGDGSLSAAGVLHLLRSHLCLDFLERLTIRDVEGTLPVNSLCLLLEAAPNLKELTLDNILLYGKMSVGDQQPICTNLERVSLSSCGPAEDSFLQWLVLQSKASLMELSVREMLLSQTTLDAVTKISSIDKLHLGSVPGLYHSNLLANLCHCPLSELYLFDPIHIKWFAEQNWILGRNLHTLSLVFYDCQSNLQQMAHFVSSSILQRQESLRNLSLNFLSSNQGAVCRGSWTTFFSGLSLRRIAQLESLQVHFADNSGWDATPTQVVDASLEAVLVDTNTRLSKFILTSPMHTFQISPAVQFYLGLNGAGRQKWFLEDEICPDILANSDMVFPENEADQLSMLFHILSNNPSWICEL